MENMNPKEYLAKVKKSGVDPNEDLHLGEIVAVLEVYTDGYADEDETSVNLGGDVAWDFMVSFAGHAGEGNAGWVAYNGLEYTVEKVNKELETQEILNANK